MSLPSIFQHRFTDIDDDIVILFIIVRKTVFKSNLEICIILEYRVQANAVSKTSAV